MNVETVTRTIQLIIAPVVMLTTCAIILGGLLTRYGAISDRMRAFSKERLELLRANLSIPLAKERLEEIDVQMPNLVFRHKLEHDAVLTVYCSTLVFILDMFVIAIAIWLNTDWAAVLSLVVFLVGMAFLGFGISFTIREVMTSQRAVTYEALHVSGLKPEIVQQEQV